MIYDICFPLGGKSMLGVLNDYQNRAVLSYVNIADLETHIDLIL